MSERKLHAITRYFSADLIALQAARLSGLNCNTRIKFNDGIELTDANETCTT